MSKNECKHKVVLRENPHEYYCELCGKVFISVTQLLKKHGITRDYSCVPTETLKRKADRGTLIHKELENYIKTGAESIFPEVDAFAEWVNKNNATNLKSEQIVHNDIIAGTVDLTFKTGYVEQIRDFKTSAEVDKKGVAWQLSFYRHLLGGVGELGVLHFPTEELKEIPIDPVPQAEIDRLIECERNGELYQTVAIILPDEMKLEAKKWAEAVKFADTIGEKIRAKFLELFEQNPGTLSVKIDELTISYVSAGTQKSIDAKALRAAMPDVAAKFEKISQRKASVRMTFKGEKDGAE